MFAEEKIEDLKIIINNFLLPLIGNKKCIYLDLPYYSNIGDTLIWEGTKCFFKANNIKYNYYASKDTFDFRDINEEIVIVLQGGGNFGDLWVEHQIFRNKVIEKYSNNKIVILPQSVHYSDSSLIQKDAELFSKHKNLTICARDKFSYDLLTKNFSNNIILLPDMAFCIDYKKLRNNRIYMCKKSLFLKRSDKEYKNNDRIQSIVPSDSEIFDWPTMTKSILPQKVFNRLFAYKTIVGFSIINKYANYVYRPFLIKEGISFINKYDHIYTTRLHGAILSLLLGKHITFFDNSYGKNSSFYDTWLSNVESIKFVR